ncbi:hypothetical protein [Vibrio mediterranei]|uniref:hypothetical protein n=1 Tax=Vibrio mediterranei TaxID=689 RepID=UPI004069047D
MMEKPSILLNGFNCTADGSEPKWGEFVSYEMSPCTRETLGSETHTTAHGLDEVSSCGTALLCGEAITSWTVYGRVRAGLAFALHDCDTREDASSVLEYCNSHI